MLVSLITGNLSFMLIVSLITSNPSLRLVVLLITGACHKQPCLGGLRNWHYRSLDELSYHM